MQKPKIPKNESLRQQALNSYKLTDTLPEQSFDDLTLLASHICKTPIALVSIIDEERQWFKSNIGLSASETHRDISFCGHAINEPDKLFEVTDTKKDARFADNPLVTEEPFIAFYAGMPLVDSKGFALGTLCVIDHIPRNLTVDQKKALKALARQVMSQIEIRRRNLKLSLEANQNSQELADSKTKYYKLYNEAPDMMISLNPTTEEVIECNTRVCKRLGYSHKEMVGKNIKELYHPDCLEEVNHVFNNLKKNGTISNKRLILKTREGNKINVSQKVTVVKDKNGTIVYLNSTWRDIEETIRVEKELQHLNNNLEAEIKKRTKELQANKERLELALSGTRDGIIDWPNVQTDELYWTPRFDEMLGYQSGELVKSKKLFLKELLHPEDFMNATEKITTCLLADLPFDLEFRLKSKSGKYQWYRGRGSGIKDSNGQVYRMTGSITDIHQQKKLELQLFETKSFLKKVTDIAPSIIYVFNQKTMSNEFVNKEIGSVLGYSIKETQDLGDQLIATLCHPTDLPKIYNHFTAITQLNDNEVATIEYRIKHKDGDYRWLLSEDTVFERDNDGRVIKHLGVATDITKLKNIQSKLSKQAKILQNQNDDLKQFAYIATHDLKSPMITLEGHFNYLKTMFKNPTEDVKESIEFIEEEISSFKSTLEGLNEAIKIKEVDVDEKPIDIKEVIHQLLPSFENQIKSVDGKIELNLADETLIRGTTPYVQSIIHNLISNAIKYKSPKRTLFISVSTKRINKHLLLTIEDNGLGIDIQLQKNKIFKMFNQFHTSSTGSGMGLFLVKNMIEKLDGKIEVDSKVDKGTNFMVYFKISE